MSWLPLVNSWLICSGLLSIFLWEFGVFLFLVPLVLGGVYYLMLESKGCDYHSSFGFWLFIVSEALIFFTMFFLVFYNEDEEGLPTLSSHEELPYLGCFLLIGSSIIITLYHHSLGLWLNKLNLVFVILLGSLFVVLQLSEFYDCSCDLYYDSFYGSSFFTVGLHFCHVVVGLVVLFIIYFFGDVYLNRYYTDLAVWYWHFVDYVWLFVFFIVYCSL